MPACVDESLPHRALLESELRGEMHASRQPKGVCVKHGIEGIERLVDLADCWVTRFVDL